MRLAFSLVLIAPPGGRVSSAAIAAAGTAIDRECELDRGWLAPETAWELLFTEEDNADFTPIIKTVRAADPALDVNIVPSELMTRRKRLLIADMESTIIEQEMLDELAGEIGLRDKVAAITERAMRGELDFEAAINERVALLAGLDAGILDRLAADRVSYMAGARTLVATMKAGGAYCALVSGGFTCFTAIVAEALGFDEHQANTLEIKDGKITGRVIPPILGREAKRAALERLCQTLEIDPVLAVAVGDGANDLDMLGVAGLGVAFRAKPNVRKAAEDMANGAVVTAGDLTALLYLQGYRAHELVGARSGAN